MSEKTKRKKWFENVKMPHTYVILITILVIMTILTHIIPAGQYQRVEDPVSRHNGSRTGQLRVCGCGRPGIF